MVRKPSAQSNLISPRVLGQSITEKLIPAVMRYPSLPALLLYPTEDNLSHFSPKVLSLARDGTPLSIKRSTCENDTTTAHPDNAVFDSKVMSRAHAQFWTENEKVSELRFLVQTLTD